MDLEYLKKCRLLKHPTQKLASEKIGISYEMYSSIEQGRRVGTIGIWIKICKALDMDANILLGLKERN